MYLINQLCTSVIHLFKSNVMNECHLKDSVQFEKKKKKRAFNYCGVRAIWKGFPASPCLERTWRLAFSLFCRLHMSPVTLIWIITEWSLFAVTFPSIALVASVRCERSSHLRPHCSRTRLWAFRSLSVWTDAECQHSEQSAGDFLQASQHMRKPGLHLFDKKKTKQNIIWWCEIG